MKDQRLSYPDPCDLDTLRQALKDADPDNRLCPILMDRIYIQKEAIELLPEIIKEHSKGNKVLMVSRYDSVFPWKRKSERADLFPAESGISGILAGAG